MITKVNNLHMLPTAEDKARLFWIFQASNHFKNRIENLSNEFAQEFAETIANSYYPEWVAEDAVDEDLSYWR